MDDSDRLSVAHMAEAAAKAGAILFGGVYLLGFLIVALHDARYGFVEFSALRVRYFATGMCFVFLTGLPSLALWPPIFKMSREMQGLAATETVAWYRLFYLVLSFFFPASAVTAWFAGMILFVPPNEPHLGWFIALVVWAAIGGFIFIYARRFPKSCIAAELITTVGFAVAYYRLADRPYFWLTLWLYCSGIATLLVSRWLRSPRHRNEQMWERHLLMVLVAVWAYATGIYPGIQPAWGGGAPIAITLRFSGVNPLGPAVSSDALMLEETDNGFYVTVPGEADKSYFVRRDQVSSIEFKSPK